MTIVFQNHALDQYQKLRPHHEAIQAQLAKIQQDPFRGMAMIDLKKEPNRRVVKFHLKGGGQYRIGYTIDLKRQEITIGYIGPRENCYRTIRRRVRARKARRA